MPIQPCEVRLSFFDERILVSRYRPAESNIFNDTLISGEAFIMSLSCKSNADVYASIEGSFLDLILATAKNYHKIFDSLKSSLNLYDRICSEHKFTLIVT